jgi:lactoylglutathione lyase
MTEPDATNVQQAVPFFRVASMEASLRYYVDGLGFAMKNRWEVDGKIRWCWLELGAAAVMLQESSPDGHHVAAPMPDARGAGVSICFMCKDALAIYREVKGRGLEASRPFVGNGMWVTSLSDPDGYRLEFESLTDVPEDTQLAE